MHAESKKVKFKIIHKDTHSSARAGEIETSHGKIQTPVFMPVGTAGTVKGIHQRDLKFDLDAPVILGNSYHLYLRPGIDIISKAGGLHKFIGWDRAILTDSGGYQVFSLSGNRKLHEEGVVFKSHIDGSEHIFTPENIVDIQRILGSDIMMALDECTPYPCEYKYAEKSLELTHKWLERGIERFRTSDDKYGFIQTYFPIVQGSIYQDLRMRSAEVISGMEMDGYAIGGLSVGEPVEMMYEMTACVTAILPEEKPRYLMGVGTPVNILECIALGVDMFDCVIPTRNGRNGMLFTSGGIINIKNKKWKDDYSTIDSNGITFVDKDYSKAYLRHLFISDEMLGAQIASIHNVGFYLWLVREAFNKISSGEFSQWKRKMVKVLDVRL